MFTCWGLHGLCVVDRRLPLRLYEALIVSLPGSMSTLPVLRASWATSDDLQQLLSDAVASVKLQKQDESCGPCTINCSFQQPLVPSQLLLCSNARMVEVSVQRPGDSTLSYLQTVRCQPKGEHYEGNICLQGDKSVCTIHQLSFQQQSEPPAPDTAASGSSSSFTAQQEAASAAVAATDPPGSSAGSAPAAAPPQQSLSQLDELRLLIQQLHQPSGGGSDEGASAVPESLQLLHSKATAAPQPGAGAAIKNLSAHIAQGMLFQAAQQRIQQQQQPQAQLPPHQQQDSLQTPAESTSSAAAPAQAGSVPVEALLSVLQRLEAKVDQLAQGMTAGLQQLDQRLARLEARCAAGTAGLSSPGPHS